MQKEIKVRGGKKRKKYVKRGKSGRIAAEDERIGAFFCDSALLARARTGAARHRGASVG